MMLRLDMKRTDAGMNEESTEESCRNYRAGNYRRKLDGLYQSTHRQDGLFPGILGCGPGFGELCTHRYVPYCDQSSERHEQRNRRFHRRSRDKKSFSSQFFLR